MQFSVKITDVFDPSVSPEEMVRRSAKGGASAVGFRPWYDQEALERVVQTVDQLELDLTYLSGGSPDREGPAFPLANPDTASEGVSDLRRAIDVAERVNCKYVNVIPGWENKRLDSAVQHLSIVRSLRQVADTAADAGVILAVEPINTAVDHPGIYLHSSYEGYKIIDAVDSPNVRLLYDIYHQQISEGNIISNIREHIDLIGYIHVGDVPGRHEPGTGEINYPVVFEALGEAGYDGVVGLECYPKGSPDDAIRAVAKMLSAD